MVGTGSALWHCIFPYTRLCSCSASVIKNTVRIRKATCMISTDSCALLRLLLLLLLLLLPRACSLPVT
jgi:hypothetical protein